MADIQFPNTLFGPGTATIVVNDNNGAPASVLEAADRFTIDVSWTVDPLFALLAGGDWEVAAYVEGIGGPGAPEQQVGATQTVPLNGGRNYNTTITVPGGTLPNDPAPPNSGVYKLVVVLIHRNFTVVSNVAAVIDGGLLRIG